MIKYAEIKGYTGLGEVRPRIYQWLEIESNSPTIILVSVYRGPNLVFKGKLLQKTSGYKAIDIKPNELKDLERFVGKLEVIRDFNVFNEKTNAIPNVKFEEIEEE